jgi:hypothetical protein
MQRSGENSSRSRSLSEQALISSAEVQSLRYTLYTFLPILRDNYQLASVSLHHAYYILLISSDFFIYLP